MLFPRRSLLLAASFLAACSEADSPVRAGAPELPLPSVELDPARPLIGYAWEARPAVPWDGVSSPDRVVYGELGRTPLTQLYLTFNLSLAEEQSLQPPGWILAGTHLSRGTGRFGDGCHMEPDSVLSCVLPEDARDQRLW